MECPLDYSLCDRTVTVYRKRDGEINRKVIEGCYLEGSTRVEVDEYGARQESPFLLIVPGSEQRVLLDDRIYDGVGPEVELAHWQEFIPVKVPGLMQVQYVKPCYWNGQLCHTEAGRKNSNFSY